MDTFISAKSQELEKKYKQSKEQGLNEQKAFLTLTEMLETILNDDDMGMSILLQILSIASDQCCLKLKDAEAFAKGFFKVAVGSGFSLDSEVAQYYEKLLTMFPNSKKMAEHLAAVYGEIVSQTQDEIYSSKLDKLTKENPTLVNSALQQVYALQGMKSKQDSIAYEKTVGKIWDLCVKYDYNTDFLKTYGSALCDLIAKQSEADATHTVSKMEDLLSMFKEDFMAVRLAKAYMYLSKKQDVNGYADTIDRLESLSKDWPDNKLIPMNLAYVLADYSLCKSGSEKSEILQRIIAISPIWAPAEEMATELANGTYEYATPPRPSN